MFYLTNTVTPNTVHLWHQAILTLIWCSSVQSTTSHLIWTQTHCKVPEQKSKHTHALLLCPRCQTGPLTYLPKSQRRFPHNLLMNCSTLNRHTSDIRSPTLFMQTLSQGGEINSNTWLQWLSLVYSPCASLNRKNKQRLTCNVGFQSRNRTGFIFS